MSLFKKQDDAVASTVLEKPIAPHPNYIKAVYDGTIFGGEKHNGTDFYWYQTGVERVHSLYKYYSCIETAWNYVSKNGGRLINYDLSSGNWSFIMPTSVRCFFEDGEELFRGEIHSVYYRNEFEDAMGRPHTREDKPFYYPYINLHENLNQGVDTPEFFIYSAYSNRIGVPGGLRDNEVSKNNRLFIMNFTPDERFKALRDESMNLYVTSVFFNSPNIVSWEYTGNILDINGPYWFEVNVKSKDDTGETINKITYLNLPKTFGISNIDNDGFSWRLIDVLQYMEDIRMKKLLKIVNDTKEKFDQGKAQVEVNCENLDKEALKNLFMNNGISGFMEPENGVLVVEAPPVFFLL